jgi:signal transduction histidine kinase/ligand-binding sensor domain-containing protein
MEGKLRKARFSVCSGIGKLAMMLAMISHTASFRRTGAVYGVLAFLTLVACGSVGTAAETAGKTPRFMVDIWTADDGLPSSAVTGLAQTADGYLWIGTHKSGLVRFDGMEFKRPTHSAQPPVPAREVTLMGVDTSGTMWVEQEGPYRLISYQNGVFANPGLTQQTPAVHLGSVLSGKEGGLLAATTDGRLVSLRGGAGKREFEQVKVPLSLARRSGALDLEGRVWLRSEAGGFGYLENGNFVSVPAGEAGPGASVQVMVRGPDGRMWVGTDEGLAVWEGGKFRRVVPEGMAVVPAVYQIAFSGDGGMWVQTATRIMKELNGRWVVDVAPWGGKPGPLHANFPLHGDADGGAWLPEAGRGLWHVAATGELVSIGLDQGLPDTLVTAWLQDREGGIWVGTPGGLARLRPQLFEVVGPAQGLRQPVVRSIAEDAAGRIWLSSADGLTLWENGQCKEVRLPTAPTDPPLTDVLAVKAREGEGNPLWIGTVGGGAFLWDEGKVLNPFPPRGVGQAVRVILPDTNGRTWFGGEFGLFGWDGGKLRRFGPADGLKPGHIFDIREGSHGDVWLGNAGAHLTRYRNGRFENWQDGELLDLLIYTVLPDGDDGVWLGSGGGGLLRWRDGKFFRYSIEHGLPSDSVSQLLDDGLGFLWGGTRQGIFRVDKHALHEVAAGLAKGAAFNLYTRDDGLPSNECSAGLQPAALKASDGRLWFSTIRGAVAVNPAAAKSSGLPLRVRIEEVRLDGVPLGNGAKLSDRPVTLPPGPHALEFRFSALTLAAPEKARFRWRMTGVDPGWIEGGFQKTVSYGGMLPGDYLFEVRACNEDGVWSREATPFRFSIESRLWERNSFQVGAVVFLIIAAAGIAAMVQRRKYRRRVAQLEARRVLEVERTRIARDLHDDLGAGLAQINISSGLLATEGIDPAFVAPLLQGIGSRSRELVTALDEIVWAVNPKNDTLDSMATYFCQYAKNFLDPAQIACRLEVAPGLPHLPLDAERRHGLFLAFAEALHNTVSHSGASEVRVAIGFENGSIHLSVSDNGRGLPAGELAPGADGLANMRERLTQLGGSCAITNLPRGGTEVAFILPIPFSSSKRR